jgi:hypothetical protein
MFILCGLEKTRAAMSRQVRFVRMWVLANERGAKPYRNLAIHSSVNVRFGEIRCTATDLSPVRTRQILLVHQASLRMH